jgi:hypothetical protein
MFIFNLNVVSQRIFSKMGLICVRFTPVSPSGAGFPGEEFAPVDFEFAPAENGTQRGKLGDSKFSKPFTHSVG